jgi:hypothetical protein
MKKVITILVLVIAVFPMYGQSIGLSYGTINYQGTGCGNNNDLTPPQEKAKKDSMLYIYLYPTFDDFFSGKKVFYGKAGKEYEGGEVDFQRGGDDNVFRLDSFGKEIKLKPKKLKPFAYQKGFMKFINGWTYGEAFVGGNKNIYATTIGGLFEYDDEGFVCRGNWTIAGGLSIHYYRGSDPTKKYSLEELVKDCPEVYKQYMESKKDKKQKKNDPYEGTGVYFADQMKFFKMYLKCISKK